MSPLVIATALSGLSASAFAQKLIADSADASAIASVVTEFITAAQDELSSDEIERFTTGQFAEKMKAAAGTTPFGSGIPYLVRNVQSVNGLDSLASVAITTHGEMLPLFGQVMIELTFFVHRDENGWRIADMRRFGRIEQRSEEIQLVTASKEFPSSLKPLIVREIGSVLLGNDQLKDNFLKHRAQFQELVTRFDGRDSLSILGRVDHNVQQLNRVALYWDAAAQQIPKEVIDEYLASATAKQRAELKAEIRRADKLRKSGRDSLSKYARRYKLNVTSIDQTVELMHALRVSFVNSELPWKDAVQLTVGGIVDNAIGYLYSPSGEIPMINSDEFYYLEELGDGWWIFRAG
ncbi:MAG: hypothetical protein H7X80_02290 [bacterium]|nr:hypothetical protein [Candidatus Kapabacteria bacterium]